MKGKNTKKEACSRTCYINCKRGEDEAREVVEEMQRNLDEVQARTYETERKLDRVLGEYIDSFEKELGRPHHNMDKMWKMMQSRDTKTLNLDKDVEEITSEVKQAGWHESTKTTGFWRQYEDEDQHSPELCAQSCMMEGIITFVAEWFSREEIKALQSVCVLTSVWAREWQYKDCVTDLDD